jgi:hypothetical protein
MAEEANSQDSTQESSAETPAVDSQSSEQTTQDTQSQDQSTESQSSDTEGNADAASTGDKSKVENQDSKQDSKPLSRRSAAYRIQQLVNENKVLKKQQEPKQEQNEWEDENASDDTPQQPDISELVQKEVEKRLNPVITEHSKSADDAEISELFTGDRAADKDKYADKIRKMWNDPKAPYKDVAAVDLYKIAKFDELQASIPAIQQQAVEDYKNAEKEAKESSASGTSNSNRSGKGGSDVLNMSSEEFQRHNEQIKAKL